MKTCLFRIAPLALILLLTACATPDWEPATDVEERGGAQSAYARGDYAAAAEAWQREALAADAARAASLRVRAADAWLQANRPDSAEDTLRWIDRQLLGSADRSRLDLVRADLALRGDRPDEAELLLSRAKSKLPSASRPRYESLSARLQEQLAYPASREISRAAAIGENMTFYDPEATIELLRVLEGVSSHELAVRAENPRADRQLTGWLDLALVIRTNLVIPDGIDVAVANWKARHQSHLLTEQQALNTWLSYRQLFAPPRRVAVLLPGSGRLQAVGEAIRDGIMSAWLKNPGGAEILFFPTADDEQSVISAYFNALDAGVDRIIGPVRRESVEAMLRLAGMATPVLALNDLPEDYVPPAYLAGQVNGISLSQEAEAEAAAQHALAAGYLKAIVLAPESSWGERMAYAFESGFLQEDQEIVAAMRYPESQNDHGALLQRALKIDESKARKQKLQNTLQVPLEFEPTRRDDVDVIFMAANPTQARQIRPQLRFHDAGSVPVYATGRIFSGQPDPSRNQDLNGVRFPATPWQLGHTERSEIPGLASLRGGALGSLFALGQDAWNLLPWIDLVNRDPDFRFPGQSGSYYSNGEASLTREPAWAEFRRGRPYLLPPVQLSSNPESPAGE
jgi:outer membrane PBP1 activator LpoA protein